MFSPLVTGADITSDFCTLLEVAAAAVLDFVVDVLLTKDFFAATPVALVVVEDLVTDVILAFDVVVVEDEVPSTFPVVFVSAVVLLVADLAVPGEAFWVDLAVVERMRLVVFLVSFSGTDLAVVDTGLRVVVVEVVAGREVVVLGNGLVAVPLTLLVSVFSVLLVGALIGLFGAVVAVVLPAVLG